MKLASTEDRHHQLFNRRKEQILTASSKVNRLTKAKKVLNKLKRVVKPGMI